VRLRGKEVYIIAGVIAVVVAVAWWFLLYNPLRNEASDLDAKIGEVQQQVTQAQNDLARLKSYEKTSPQTRADLLRLNKMLPSQTGIPSIIIELTRTAEESGMTMGTIQPGDIAAGQPFSVQPIQLLLSGEYFDIEDFLFRLESYVEYRNNAFLVTGRLLQVASLNISASTDDSSRLQVDIVINAYLWTATGASSANTTPPAPQPSPSPTETTSPSPTETEGITPSPTGTELPTPSPAETGVTTPTPGASTVRNDAGESSGGSP